MTATDLVRSENETLLDYHKRLIYGKLVDKTLADMDYSEIAELVYGQTYQSDSARKMLYGSKRTLELLEQERISEVRDEDVLEAIDAKMVELQKERQKFFDQRREYNKIVTNEARTDHLNSRLAEAAEKLIDTVGVLYGDSDAVNFTVDQDNEAVLVLSDWHYGMTTKNVFNEYNTEVCKARVKQVVSKAIDRILLHTCSKLHIVVLGDLCHGAIHTSARVASEELACDQLMQVSEILAQSIEELSQYVQETNVYITYGNHARTVQNKKDSIHRDNMERIIPWWLEQRLKEHPDISIIADDGTEFQFINAAGHEGSASHGDLDSVRSSPRLLGTLFMKKYGKDIEFALLGDKHHRESLEELGIDAILCGALCGSDDYASEKRMYSTPSQLLLIFNKDIGLDAEYRLKCA